MFCDKYSLKKNGQLKHAALHLNDVTEELLSSPSPEAGQQAVGCIHLRCMSQSSAPALEPLASRTQSRFQ